MKANDFEFDGKRLSEFGFIICSFDSKGLETYDGAEISFNSVPTLGGSKFELVSTQYENCLEATIQICKNLCSGGALEIQPHEHRNLTKWLNRKKFLKFKLLSDEYIDLYFEATFTKINKIEVDGKIVGLELDIITNSPYAFKEQKTNIVVCSEDKKVYGWEKYDGDIKLGYVTSKDDENAYPSGLHTDGYSYVYAGQVYKSSINDTSYEEGYIYPYVEIIIKEDGDLKIYNSIENRDTYIANCVDGEVITMDYPIIQSSKISHNIQNDFNWNFFRIANTYKKSRNDLIVSLPCTIKIKYSPIVKVGL